LKRTYDNCKYIKKIGEPGRDSNGKCLGFARSEYDDEPIDVCKYCKCQTSYGEIKIEEI